MTEHREIEAKFLEIHAEALVQKLRELGAEDLGEDVVQEVIIYDKELTWRGIERFIRVRKMRGKALVAYKHHHTFELGGTDEVEFEVSDFEKAKAFFMAIGFVVWREQEKKRHTFHFGNVAVDIDTWPKIPTYAEIEGDSENQVREAAGKLGFDWNEAVFVSSGKVIEERYGIPVMGYRHFTFSKIG